MKKYTLYQIDSFTKTMFKGNPAGVITNADNLSDSDMQSIAGELNNSETAFFFSSCENDYDGILRYFTPATEVPSCGHATIAALYAKAIEDNLPSCVLRIKTNIGILPIEVIKHEDDYIITMTQGRIEISEPLPTEDRDELLAALKLTANDLNQDCPIQIASTGHSKVMIGIESRKVLNDIEPDNNRLIMLSKKINCNGYFVFTFDSINRGVLTEGRMFAPAIGIAEDPVTGNANGPLGAYLIHNKIMMAENDLFRFVGFQGEKIGRPGKVEVEVIIKEKKPAVVKILGEATIVFKSQIEI